MTTNTNRTAHLCRDLFESSTNDLNNSFNAFNAFRAGEKYWESLSWPVSGPCISLEAWLFLQPGQNPCNSPPVEYNSPTKFIFNWDYINDPPKKYTKYELRDILFGNLAATSFNKQLINVGLNLSHASNTGKIGPPPWNESFISKIFPEYS